MPANKKEHSPDVDRNRDEDDLVYVRCCRKSFNIYKPQVQGVSLSTSGVVRRELYFQLLEFTRASQSRRDQW